MAPVPEGVRFGAAYNAERVIRTMVGRCADQPAAIGWQADNEPAYNLLSGIAVAAGEAVSLGACDVRVLVQEQA